MSDRGYWGVNMTRVVKPTAKFDVDDKVVWRLHPHSESRNGVVTSNYNNNGVFEYTVSLDAFCVGSKQFTNITSKGIYGHDDELRQIQPSELPEGKRANFLKNGRYGTKVGDRVLYEMSSPFHDFTPRCKNYIEGKVVAIGHAEYLNGKLNTLERYRFGESDNLVYWLEFDAMYADDNMIRARNRDDILDPCTAMQLTRQDGWYKEFSDRNARYLTKTKQTTRAVQPATRHDGWYNECLDKNEQNLEAFNTEKWRGLQAVDAGIPANPYTLP